MTSNTPLSVDNARVPPSGCRIGRIHAGSNWSRDADSMGEILVGGLQTVPGSVEEQRQSWKTLPGKFGRKHLAWPSYQVVNYKSYNPNHVSLIYLLSYPHSQDTAQHAFKFCIKYQRRTEFRKLCDNLRMHLGHITKHSHQASAINLNNPDSQVYRDCAEWLRFLPRSRSNVWRISVVNAQFSSPQAMHLETRLAQLDTAITMELWQEAYKVSVVKASKYV